MKKLIGLFFIFGILGQLNAKEINDFYSTKIAKEKYCSDAVFVRRVYLTITGRLPQPEIASQFLNANKRNKRAELIDRLLESEEYLKYFVMRWGDILRIKSEFPSNIWPNGVQAYNRWLYEKISSNTPYDTFTKELLLSKGSDFRSPAVNFYRAFPKRTPENIYNNINLLFLGNRKTADEGKVCFSQIRYKSTREWKEEIVYVDEHLFPIVNQVKMTDGKTLSLGEGQDWREAYVNWLTNKENKRFGAVMVNRLWYWVMGKGIVNEPDNWNASNPPSQPELLEFLTTQFITSGYDMKYMLRNILNSYAFQSKTFPDGEYEPQRLLAEIIVDAIADITGMPDAYRSRVPEPFTFYPQGTHAIELGDATVSSSALELFGRASRDVSLENQHINRLTSRQLLYLMNSSELEDKIRKSVNLNRICKENTDIDNLITQLTLLTLSRYPTEKEKILFKNYASTTKMPLRDLVSDFAWTQLNSYEFLYNH